MVQSKVAEPIIFMDQPAEFEWLRGNLFRVIDPNTGIERIVEARIFAETIANAARCYSEYRSSQGAEIIPFQAVDAAH